VPRGIGELQVADMVQLCLDPVSERCWLRLRNFASVYPGLSGDEVIDVYVGAIKQKDTWIAMDPGRRPSTFLMFDLAGACGSARKITEFQRAIISDWQRFDGANLSHFAKGTTFGKSYTSASFAAKALKTGFDAVGLPAPAYSGVKASGWSVADLRKYAQARQGMLGFRDRDMLSMSDLVSDFMELPPITRY